MKRISLIGLVVMIIAAGALAQPGQRGPRDEGERQRPPMGPGHGPMMEGPGHGPQMNGPEGEGPPPGEFMQALHDLNLSEDQREQIGQLLQNQREQVRQFMQDHGQAMRDARQAMAEARRSGDEEAMDAARQQFQDLMDQRRQLHEQFRTDLAEILSDEQLTQLDRLIGPGSRVERFVEDVRSLDLTDEQSQQIDQILNRARAAAEDTDNTGQKVQVMARAHRAIMDVLTDEQRQQLHQRMRRQMQDRLHERIGDALELTDEQAEQFQQATANLREAMAASDSREDHQAAMEQFRSDLEGFLSDEQLQKLRRMHQRMRQQGPEGPGGPPSHGPGEGQGPQDGQGPRGPRDGQGQGHHGPREQ